MITFADSSDATPSTLFLEWFSGRDAHVAPPAGDASRKQAAGLVQPAAVADGYDALRDDSCVLLFRSFSI